MNKVQLEQIKKEQRKALDSYALEAKTDAGLRKFMVEMAIRLNTILHDLDTKENEES